MERDKKYDEVISGIHQLFEGRIVKKLYDIKDACERAGLLCDDPMDMCDDEYRWSLPVRLSKGTNEGAFVEIVIDEQREHDGELDEDDNPTYGLNFSINITHTDGRILGGVTPFNYTPLVWVDARIEDVVEERWRYIEQLDNFPIPTLIKEA